MKKIILLALIVVMLTGCASTQKWICDHPKTAAGIAVGVATGGLAGGLIGHQVGHTAGALLIGGGLGGIAGGLIGNEVEDRETTSEGASPTSSALD
jgi:uncharacterized protein YcfJ